MSYGMVLTLTQALQLVGLAPCLFIMLFLCTLLRRNAQAAIPIFYFMALASSFTMPLLNIYPSALHNPWLEGSLLLVESTLTAFGFLLILQFMTGRLPALPYWLVLAIPLLGGSLLVYADLLQGDDRCVIDQSCTDIVTIKSLYNIFSSAMVFLLLVYYSSRFSVRTDDIHKRHKYWLIIALILLHLLVLAVDLGRLLGHLSQDESLFAATMLRLTFIYLVITSLFRVFYPEMARQAMPAFVTRPYDLDADKPYVQQIIQLLEGERLYRQMRLNRAGLAEKIGIGEHHLSRVINRHFNKNFNELINGYRITEAKQRLRSETSPITTIGFEVGFNSIASFNRVFRDQVGFSPSEYRAKAIQGFTPSES